MTFDTVPPAIKRLADQLRAAQAAALTDPNTPPWKRKLLEARQREEGAQLQKPIPTRTRKRKPTLTGVARQAARAGIEVAGYEVRPDGTISIVTGKPVGASDIDVDRSPDPKWN